MILINGKILKENKNGVVREFKTHNDHFYNVYFYTSNYREILNATYKTKKSALLFLSIFD